MISSTSHDIAIFVDITLHSLRATSSSPPQRTSTLRCHLGLFAIVFWWAAVWIPVGAPVAKVIIAGVTWKEAALAKES